MLHTPDIHIFISIQYIKGLLLYNSFFGAGAVTFDHTGTLMVSVRGALDSDLDPGADAFPSCGAVAGQPFSSFPACSNHQERAGPPSTSQTLCRRTAAGRKSKRQEAVPENAVWMVEVGGVAGTHLDV